MKVPDLAQLPPLKEVVWLIVPAVLFLVVLLFSIIGEGSQQFSLLSQAFWHGQLHFLKPIGGAGQDPIFYKGHVYWSEGPFPAIFLMPFVGLFDLFNKFFYQGYIMWALSLSVLYLIYKLARHFNYSKCDSLFLSLGFCLASVFIAVASVPASWYFAQVLTTALLFLALYLYFAFENKAWLLLGVLGGLIVMTRATAAPIVIVFLLDILFNQKDKKISKVLKVILPILGALLILGLYNIFRFGNFLTSKYGQQVLFPASTETRSLGLFSLIHLPTNLYYLFLATPVGILRSASSWTLKFPYIKSNPVAMSIFITSPYILYLFFQKKKNYDKKLVYLLISVLISAFLLMIFFAIGIVQYGYRYSLDFLPALYLIFMVIYRRQNPKLSSAMKITMTLSAIFNFWLMLPVVY